MRLLSCLALLLSLYSCWPKPRTHSIYEYRKVWGNKPVYATVGDAKQITYVDSALPVTVAGNICVLANRIYQLEIGRGIHVIDNSDPATAHRIGFIAVYGCSQVSVKDDHLYVNNFDDLVVLDLSASNSVTVVNRIAGAFVDGLNNYYLMQPEENGFYECPVNDSIVIGWRKDSIWNSCFKD